MPLIQYSGRRGYYCTLFDVIAGTKIEDPVFSSLIHYGYNLCPKH